VATVVSKTSIKIDELIEGTIISGYIDGAGHLILVNRGGGEMDVPSETDIVVELEANAVPLTIVVLWDGVQLLPSEYSLVGDTLTITNPGWHVGDKVWVRYSVSSDILQGPEGPSGPPGPPGEPGADGADAGFYGVYGPSGTLLPSYPDGTVTFEY
jgi:hypothetical protein